MLFLFLSLVSIQFRIGNAMVRHKVKNPPITDCVCVCVWGGEVYVYSVYTGAHVPNGNVRCALHVFTGSGARVCGSSWIKWKRINGFRRLWHGISTRLCIFRMICVQRTTCRYWLRTRKMGKLKKTDSHTLPLPPPNISISIDGYYYLVLVLVHAFAWWRNRWRSLFRVRFPSAHIIICNTVNSAFDLAHAPNWLDFRLPLSLARVDVFSLFRIIIGRAIT